MRDSRVLLLFWLVNSLVLFFAPLALANQIVVGTSRLNPFLASIISGFILTLAVSVTMPVFKYFKIKFAKEWQTGMVFLFVNVLSIWVIARYADLTGVGISNAWIAVLLGITLNMLQWGLWKYLKNKKMME